MTRPILPLRTRQPLNASDLTRLPFLRSTAALTVLFSLAGCHSAFVQATVKNDSSRPINLFEVDYPTASFGSENLAPGAEFRYRFKILGDGATKLTWTDTSQHEQSTKGPDLQEGQEGDLMVTFGPNGKPTWSGRLHKP